MTLRDLRDKDGKPPVGPLLLVVSDGDSDGAFVTTSDASVKDGNSDDLPEGLAEATLVLDSFVPFIVGESKFR